MPQALRYGWLLGGSLLVACLPKSEPWQEVGPIEMQHVLEGVSTLRVKNGIGRLVVQASADAGTEGEDAAQVRVRGLAKYRGHLGDGAGQELLEWLRSGDTLELASRHVGDRDERRWRFDLTVELPPRIGVSLQTGMGDVRVEGELGALQVAMGAGALDVDGAVHSLFVRSGTGSMRAMLRDAPEVDIKAGHGDVILTLPAGLNAKGARVDVGKGDVQILLPPQAAVSLDLVAGLGAISIPPNARKSEGSAMLSSKMVAEMGAVDVVRPTLQVKTGMGDVQVKVLGSDP